MRIHAKPHLQRFGLILFCLWFFRFSFFFHFLILLKANMHFRNCVYCSLLQCKCFSVQYHHKPTDVCECLSSNREKIRIYNWDTCKRKIDLTRQHTYIVTHMPTYGCACKGLIMMVSSINIIWLIFMDAPAETLMIIQNTNYQLFGLQIMPLFTADRITNRSINIVCMCIYVLFSLLSLGFLVFTHALIIKSYEHM